MTTPVGPAPSSADAAGSGAVGRWRAAVEAAVVCGLALFAIFQVIPQQTASGEDAAGLAPATLPTACAVAIAVLALLNLAVTWSRRRGGTQAPASGILEGAATADDEGAGADLGQAASSPSSPTAVIGMMLVCLAGAIVLRYAGPAACTATIVPLGMIALGERRPIRILLVTIVAVLPYLVLFR